MPDLTAIVRLIGGVGFFVSMGGALICIVRLLDERRGRRVAAARLLFFPFFIPREDFTERGARLYDWFLRLWGIGFAFWVLLLLLTAFG